MTYTGNTRTVLTDQVPEFDTVRLACSLLDDEGGHVTGLTALTLTLHEESTDGIVNSVVQEDISADYTTSGGLIHYLSSDDNVMLTDCPVEQHIALLQYSWLAGARHGQHEIKFPVRRIVHTTTTST